MLSNVQLDNRDYLNVGEIIRIGADSYTIMKNGVEVQQITVHRSSSVANGEFYQLKVTFEEVVDTTACLTFEGGVSITKTDTSSGFLEMLISIKYISLVSNWLGMWTRWRQRNMQLAPLQVRTQRIHIRLSVHIDPRRSGTPNYYIVW